MPKTEVYSWRLSPETKSALEGAARRERITLAALLDRIAREWLDAKPGAEASDAEEQARLHAAAANTLGTIAGGDPYRAERARILIRRKLRGLHARRRVD